MAHRFEPDEIRSLLEAAEQIDNQVTPETERKASEVRRAVRWAMRALHLDDP